MARAAKHFAAIKSLAKPKKNENRPKAPSRIEKYESNSKPSQEVVDSQDIRAEKILSVRQQIADLRADYSVRERKKQLKELESIYQQLRELLTTRPL